MPEIGSEIRNYFDEMAPPIGIGDVTARAPLPAGEGGVSPQGRRTRLIVAAAACVALVACVTLIVNTPESKERVEAGPASTAPGDGDWSWLTSSGAEVPQPEVPEGWKSLDFAEVRFAVPDEWVVPVSRSCATAASGVVLVSDGVEPGPSCSPSEPLPESVLTIERAAGAGLPGDAAMVGTLPATRISGPTCSGCPHPYRLDNGYQVSVTGPDAQRVLDTFTDSGARRMRQTGTEADNSGWRAIDFEGLSLRVPALWESSDIPASYSERRTATGISRSGMTNPGACGGAMFAHDRAPQVFLGTSRMVHSCPPRREVSLEPGDGLWIRSVAASAEWTDADTAAIGNPVGHGDVNGLDITVVQPDQRTRRTPGPVFDLVVDDGTAVHWISLGVGLDTSVARSILYSLHAGIAWIPPSTAATPSTVPPAAPTTTAVPVSTTSSVPPMAPTTPAPTVARPTVSCQTAVAVVVDDWGGVLDVDFTLTRDEVVSRADADAALARWAYPGTGLPPPTGDSTEQVAACVFDGFFGYIPGPSPQPGDPPRDYTAAKYLVFEDGSALLVARGKRDQTDGTVLLLPSDG